MLFLALLVTAALGAPYDYEYFDPATGQTLPPAPASTVSTASYPQAGAYVAPQAGTFGASSTFPTTTTYGSALPAGTVYGGSTLSAGTVISGPSVAYGGTTYGGVYGGSPVVVQGGAYGGIGPRPQPQQQQPDLRALQAEANYQQRLHQYNSRVITQSSQDQARLSLFDTLLNPDGHSDGFAILRFRNQARTVDALRSEKRIAAKNADLAYDRYRQDPSRLNFLVSKYSDLNEQLRDASLQYNTVNAGTFGQSLRSSFSLFGGASLTSLLVSRQETNNLQNIQRRMQRVAQQLSNEVRARQQQGSRASQGASVQGSASQRLVAMNAYGPARAF